MREIRFRAWNKFERIMFSPMPIIDFKTMEINGIEVMQYTGLKDKNGKEIYEGDIVKAKSKRVNVVYEVYWEEHSCQFRCCANRDRQFDKTHLMDWADEIIGNIYENKELLECKTELCPKCKADVKVWKEMLHEKHFCKGE